MTTTSTRVHVSDSAWTDLGAGPLQVQALDFDVVLATADSAPAASDTGFLLSLGTEQPTYSENTASHVYAKAVASYGANIEVAPLITPTIGSVQQATSPWIVQQTAALPAGTNTLGGVVLKPSAVAPGQTASRVVAAGTKNETNLKNSAGNIVSIDLFNVAAYAVFLKIYDKATTPAAGTDTPILTVPIPANSNYSRDFRFGKPCTLGIGYAITKLQADSDTTVIVAGDVTGAIAWI